MKIGAMFTDVINAFFQRTATRLYPVERTEAPVRLRGQLQWDASKCTACSLCAKDCPAEALEVRLVDKASKRIRFEYHVDRCTYCAQCVISCRLNALTMSHDTWELSGTDTAAFDLVYGNDANDGRVDDRAPAGS